MTQSARVRIALATFLSAAMFAPTAWHSYAQSNESPALLIRGPASVDLKAQLVSFDVDVENVENLGGFQFVFTFDDAVFDFIEFRQGAFLGSTDREAACDEPQQDTGALRVVCVTLGQEPEGAHGDGTIATFVLQPKSEGASMISVNRLVLTSVSSIEITATVENASVRVGGSSGGMNWLVWGAAAGAASLLAIAALAALLRRAGSGHAPATL